jgi:hypothetical protein
MKQETRNKMRKRKKDIKKKREEIIRNILRI